MNTYGYNERERRTNANKNKNNKKAKRTAIEERRETKNQKNQRITYV